MDRITVIELSRPTGARQNSPQLYEMTIKPGTGKKRPELDFLHKGDAIVLDDDVIYIVEQAKQQYVPSKMGGVFSDGHWVWVYQVVKDRSNEGEGER